MAVYKISDTINFLNKASDNPPDDVEERRKLYKAARRLMFSVETPHETTQRIYYGGFALPLAIVGIDLGLFKVLADHSKTLHSLNQLAKTTGADGLLLSRVLRGLVAHGLVGETTQGTYYANEKTMLLCEEGFVAGTKHNHLLVNPALHCLPEFLNSTQYKNPSDSRNTAFQVGHNTDQTTFEWLSHRPNNLKWTMRYMATQRNNQTNWMMEPEIFPVDDFTIRRTNNDSEGVLMVDVGGGAGHQCIALRQAHPELQGRVVLQDLPGTIAITDQNIFQMLRIESQGHDFMTPQPIIGAKAYYMRNVLHDWPDKTCVAILEQLRAAMDKDSVIVIDEMVVGSTDSTWKQVNYDLVMMCAIGGMERTKAQWQELVLGADLELREVIRYDDETGDSLIIVEPRN